MDVAARAGPGGRYAPVVMRIARSVAVAVYRCAALVACAVLVAGPPGWRPAPALAGGAAVKAQPAAPADPAGPVPCPTVTVPGASRPPAPSPPPRDPSVTTDRPIGGDALGTPGLVVPPGTATPPAVTARAWLVADLDSGAVLGACGPHERYPPASVQKLLLAATVLPRLDPAQVVEVTKPDMDFEPGSSAVGLLVGGRYTVETLWLGLLLNSGNDAANVLARLGGGEQGVAGTMAAMNAEARRLGAYDTHAVTPSGLDGPGQVTSVYDLALIARACFAREDFRRYVATRRTQIPAQPPKDPRGFQIQNDNPLLDRYPGALGGKTGFTDLARHTYVGAAERDGRRLVVTILSAEARPVRAWQQGAALLDWGFRLPRDAAVGRLVEPGELEAPRSSPSPSPAPVPEAAAVGSALRGRTVAAIAGVAVGMLAVATASGMVVMGSRRPRGQRRRRR